MAENKDEAEMALISEKKPLDAGEMKLPDFILNMKMEDSYRGGFKSEPAKEKAKAGMARRMLSIDESDGPVVVGKEPPPEICERYTEQNDTKATTETQQGKTNPDEINIVVKSSSDENEKTINVDVKEVPDSDTVTPKSGNGVDVVLTDAPMTRENALENTALLDKEDKGVESQPDETDTGQPASGMSFCCIRIKTEPPDGETWPPKFRLKDLFIAFMGFFTFAFDYVTDILLLVEYINNNDMVFFYLTLGFICAPSIISGIISALWYKMYYRRDKRKEYEHAKKQYLMRTIASFLQLGRLWRQGEYIFCVAHSIWLRKKEGKEKEVQKLRLRATEEKRDAAILGLIDGFMESAMQLLLQIYLTAHYRLDVTYWRRLFALLSSWLSTSMIITTYYRANRRALREKKNVDYFSSLFYLCWRLCELGPRYILLGLTLAYFSPWVFIFAVCHVIFVAVLYKRSKAELGGICEDPVAEKKNEPFTDIENTENGGEESETKKNREGCGGCGIPRYLFLFVISFIGLLSFINLREGKTRYVTFIYYVVYYIENIIMVALIIFVAMLPAPECYILVVAPIGIVGHVVFAGLFYYLFHPEVSGKRRVIAPRCKLVAPCAK